VNLPSSRLSGRGGLALSAAPLLLALAACQGGTTTSPSASEAATPTPSVVQSIAPSIVPSDVPSVAPSASAGAGSEGIALADVDHTLLIDALADFGFTMDAEPTTTEDGYNIWNGSAEGGEVEVQISESDAIVDGVAVYDYSAGDVGLEEMGYLIGIFAPEAEEWLVEQVTMALDDPGTPMEAFMDFENVRLVFEAFTDDTQSLDLYVVEKP
jgi:hypothetical protein